MGTERIWLAAAMAGGLIAGSARAADELEKGFAEPPASARPHTWWHWVDGNVSKEGITADLEAMARVGVGGAQIFNVGTGMPHGPIQYNSPAWTALVKHAAKEAKRLGLELCIHNCAGWSSSGGPWLKPEQDMQVVVSGDTRVTGPSRFDGALARPPANLDTYRDIAVLAFPTPAGEKTRMADAQPAVTVLGSGKRAAEAADGQRATLTRLPLPKAKAPTGLQFQFAQPFPARMLTLVVHGPFWRTYGGRLEASDDGTSFRTVTSFALNLGEVKRMVPFAPVSAKVYRVVFTRVDPEVSGLPVAEAELSGCVAIGNLPGKTFVTHDGDYRPTAVPDLGDENRVARDRIVDLTGKMSAEGRLAWDVPAGDWTILRVGYTPNGHRNAPAPAEGAGLECDKLNPDAAQAFWDGGMGPLLAELGKVAGKSDTGLNNVLIDSYEVGAQNWTRGFAEIFKARNGYELTKFLPVFSGRIVDGDEITERFLWDLRRTVADLFAANYAEKMAALAHGAGLKLSVEPYGNGPFEDIQYGRAGDIPMSEFWAGKGALSAGNAKLAASVAHINGRAVVGAESFTVDAAAGKWQKDPYSIKALGDVVYCGGVNRIIYHRFAHQPWTGPTRYPGMTMGPWGIHFDRTVTWWEQGAAWLTYQARCQHLLQSGRFVADVLFYCGESAPNSLRAGELPPGYDYDGCDTFALKQLTVKDGRVVLPSGMIYRLLVLPGDKAMTPDTLRVIGKLVEAGAAVVGPKPEKSCGLRGYPACDEESKRLADEVWAKGVRAQSPKEALAALKVPPDFTAENAAHVRYIHRSVDGAEVYFVADSKPVADEVECSFRVSGKVPELWHPESGKIERAPVYTDRDGRTTLRLRFEPAGSVFVVFRRAASGDPAVAVRAEIKADARQAAKPAYELAILKAEYGAFDDSEDAEPGCVDVTKAVRRMVKRGTRSIPATNDLGGDPASNVPKEMKIDYTLNGETKSVKVRERQNVELPAGAVVERAVYGVIPEHPAPKPAKHDQTLDVTAKLAALVKDGALSAKIDNALAGRDPASMTVKELRLDYRYRGQTKHVRVAENALLMLPEESGSGAAAPDYELAADCDGAVEVRAWKPGTFEVVTASGKTLKATADAVPAPVEVSGPWTLNFPPNWGAPVSVTLDRLISWTEHADEGVKYFSGTATYVKTFEWASKKQRTERYVLDLGDLKNLAEVELNGQKFGVLWKPPFRVDVTDALRKGGNTLKVKVTNLWPNRLIGDEMKADDREWAGAHVKEIPQWVQDGKPSPTGRFTFTTWHHWTADDDPLPSGLFGPVQIRTVGRVAVK